VLKALGRVYVSLACGLLAVAVALSIVDALTGSPPVASPSAGLAGIPYYERQSWTARFIADQEGVGTGKVHYEPFTVWRRPPYASETVNVGPDRLRVVPGSDCSPGAKKVWFFGGSTMWGTSSPDGGTIPALFLSGMRERSTTATCVRNFGEGAWGSTQEVIELVRALQRGEVPDVAVFYDGANDLDLAFDNGDPYGHAELPRITALFEREGRGRGARRAPERSLRELLRWFAPGLAGRLDAARPLRARNGRRRQGDPELVLEAIRVLRVNREIVRGIATRFGFAAHFFWQPCLLAGRKPLAPGEQAILAREKRRVPAFLEMVEQANVLVADGGKPDETDLSRVFEGTTEQVYTDPVHVTPQGNEIVARAILAVLGDRVAGGPRAGGR